MLARRRLLAPMVLLALTIGVHWKTLLTTQYESFDSPDLTYQVAPWIQAQAVQWHRHHPLLWDPYQVGGQSLIGQAQPGSAYPFNWFLFLFAARSRIIRDTAINWYMALIRFMAALACYALCRDLGRSRAASILGASAFAFAGYLATTAWPQMLNGAVWGPLVFLFSLRAFREQKPLVNAILSGAFLGLAWLSGHHQIPIYTTLAISGVWLYHILQKNRVERALRYLALVVTMLLVSALQTFPALSYAQGSIRWVNASHALTWNEPVPYSVHDQFALNPVSVLGTFLRGLFTNSNPFVGIAVLVLAILAVALAWNEYPVRLFSAVAAAGLIFAFGNPTILHGIIYSLIPFVEKARNPAMAVYIFHLGVCVLAAFGVDALLENAQSIWIRRAMIACGAVAAGIWLLQAAVWISHTAVNARLLGIGVTGVVAVALIILFHALRTGSIQPRTVPVLLIALVMLEVGSLTQMDYTNRDDGQKYWSLLSRDPDLAAFLRSRPGPIRIDVDADDIPYNFGDWYGIESYMGYVASAPQPFMTVQGEPRTHDLFGVRYYVAKKPPRAGLTEIFSSTTGIKIFETTAAMPRVWTVHEALPLHDLDELAPRINSIDFNKTTLLLDTPPPLETCSGDQFHMTRHDVHRVTLDVSMACRGMVIIGDGYSKDWHVTIDGQPAPLYAAYSMMRGVVLSVVTTSYRSPLSPPERLPRRILHRRLAARRLFHLVVLRRLLTFS